MTGKELIAAAIGLIDETDTTSYEASALPKINLVLAECFDLNNRRREYAEKEPLTDIPVITSVDDNITYETDLLYRVLPLGLICRLFVGEDNIPVLSMYKQEYEYAIRTSDRYPAVSTYALEIGG